MYLSMWCRECQHTMAADPETTLTCPNCGSARLGAVMEAPSSEGAQFSGDADLSHLHPIRERLRNVGDWLVKKWAR